MPRPPAPLVGFTSKIDCRCVPGSTAGLRRREQRLSRPALAPLAAGRDQMIGYFGDHFDVRTSPRQDLLVHPAHIRLGETDQRFDRGRILVFVLKRNDNAQNADSREFCD